MFFLVLSCSPQLALATSVAVLLTVSGMEQLVLGIFILFSFDRFSAQPAKANRLLLTALPLLEFLLTVSGTEQLVFGVPVSLIFLWQVLGRRAKPSSGLLTSTAPSIGPLTALATSL